MKRDYKNLPSSHDTPVVRKRRLQKRLKEMSAKSEQELLNVMRSIEQIKSSFKTGK
jgi:hypothetical protein